MNEHTVALALSVCLSLPPPPPPQAPLPSFHKSHTTNTSMTDNKIFFVDFFKTQIAGSFIDVRSSIKSTHVISQR